MPNVIEIRSNRCFDNVYLHLFNPNRDCDLSFVQAGFHLTRKGYSYGPMIRDHYLIHFIISGEGRLELHNRNYYVKEGNCFLIYPHQISYYESSKDKPWKYVWLGVSGFKAESLLSQAGFSYENEIRPIVMRKEIEAEFQKFFQFITENGVSISPEDTLYLTAMAYRIFYYLAKSRRAVDINQYEPEMQRQDNKAHSQESEYVRSIISIMQTSYFENIMVEKIAEKLGLNRSYLNTIFKNHTGMSIKEYLTDYRISVSKKLLSDYRNSVQEVALRSGFSDPLYFSRLFKKNTGYSPALYRKAYFGSEQIVNL